MRTKKEKPIKPGANYPQWTVKFNREDNDGFFLKTVKTPKKTAEVLWEFHKFMQVNMGNRPASYCVNTMTKGTLNDKKGGSKGETIFRPVDIGMMKTPDLSEENKSNLKWR